MTQSPEEYRGIMKDHKIGTIIGVLITFGLCFVPSTKLVSQETQPIRLLRPGTVDVVAIGTDEQTTQYFQDLSTQAGAQLQVLANPSLNDAPSKTLPRVALLPVPPVVEKQKDRQPVSGHKWLMPLVFTLGLVLTALLMLLLFLIAISGRKMAGNRSGKGLKIEVEREGGEQIVSKLLKKSTIFIGRSLDMDICVDDAFISRELCMLSKRERDWWVLPTSQTNPISCRFVGHPPNAIVRLRMGEWQKLRFPCQLKSGKSTIKLCEV